MEFVALLTAFASQGVPTWVLLVVLALAGYWFFYREASQGSRDDRKQLDARTQALLDDLQEQLAREREYGKQFAQRIDDLSLELAEMRGQNLWLDKNIKMFVACYKPDCPFKDVRKTLQ